MVAERERGLREDALSAAPDQKAICAG